MQLKYYLFILPILAILSCNSKSSNLDWKNQEVEITSVSLHKSLQEYKDNPSSESYQKFKNSYPFFMDIYFKHLLPWRLKEDPKEQEEQFKEFVSYKDYSNLIDTVVLEYPKVDHIDKDLIKLFKHIKATDVDFMIPDTVFYYTSGINQSFSVILNEHSIAISLDMFLGKNYPHYQNIEPPIPNFILSRMERRHIPIWVAQNIYQDHYPFHLEIGDFLQLMLQKGKEYYFLEQVLPDLKMHEIFGYTPEQMDWAEKNERNIYNYFLENELLYSKNPVKIMRFLSETHSTVDFSPESPGNLGSFIGWKIIRKFATFKNNIKEVMDASEDATILKNAMYKP